MPEVEPQAFIPDFNVVTLLIGRRWFAGQCTDGPVVIGMQLRLERKRCVILIRQHARCIEIEADVSNLPG